MCVIIRIVKRISFGLGLCSFGLWSTTLKFLSICRRANLYKPGCSGGLGLKLYRIEACKACGAIITAPLYGSPFYMRPPGAGKLVPGMCVSAIGESFVSVGTQNCGLTD